MLKNFENIFPNSADSYDKKQIIQNWINKKNQDGYTALHMAAFKGNIVAQMNKRVDKFNFIFFRDLFEFLKRMGQIYL